MDQPTAEQALQRLEPLIGEWTLEAIGSDGQPWPGEAGATFEWHDSGRHVVERSHVDMPEAPDGVCVIGCDAANGTYWQLYTDDRGVCRVYEMSIDESSWKLWRSGEPFASGSPRRSRTAATRSEAAGRSPRTRSTSRPTSTSSTGGLQGAADDRRGVRRHRRGVESLP